MVNNLGIMMMRKIIYAYVIVLFVISSGVAAESQKFTFSNYVRAGFDDNVFQSGDDELSSGYISDILNLSGKLLFSDRSDLLLYWQPEVRYRFETEDKTLVLQDFYASYQNALSRSTTLNISDRYRYSELDYNQTSENNNSSEPSTEYGENNLNGSVVQQINERNNINVGASLTNRRNDNDSSVAVRTRDFDRFGLSGLLMRKLDKDKQSVSLGYQYSNHEVANNGGGIESGTLFVGYDRIFTPRFISTLQLGYTDAEIEHANSTGTSDSTNPFFELGFNYDISERTRLNSNFTHSLRYTTLTAYNAEERSDILLSLKHDLTAKVNLAVSISYILSDYEFKRVGGNESAEDRSTILNFRSEYRINRNHFVEVGYQGRFRDAKTSVDYERNRVYLGWKLQL
jgi:hypothetical protein